MVLDDRKKNLAVKAIKMGGRKRKKVVKRMRKSIPKIFACPNCGERTLGISINRSDGIATIKCGRCTIEDTVSVNRVEEAVDAYGKFVDKYYGGEKTVSHNAES
jgi:transcription elongation factor Elf1